ncbi:kinetochore-associated Ndc80 complex subunit spc25 [Ceratobasidium sp. 394]|nr:kinetochore-associated Ndc80 complex subunit spc25 [Ceratobasidium sp. 394]KAG9102191.1 kinetochore-associated Ndc80 complex subunit spc25 [Ceratobasidium sp. UAMH 11750]
MASTKQPTRPALVTDLRKTLGQQNPVIPLYFESTQERMVALKSALTAYVTSGQAEIARRKDKYETLQRRERNKVAQMNAEIEQFRVDEMNLLKQLKTEQEEQAETEAKLAEFNARLKDIDENRVAVDAELGGLRAKVEKLKLEKSKDLAKLERQAAMNEPEARALEDLLKWNVEGVDPNVIRIKFTHVDEANPAREFSFVMDLSESRYKVSTSSPLLPQMSGLVDWLNETREFYWFVKKVRMAFQQYVQDERRAMRAA